MYFKSDIYNINEKTFSEERQEALDLAESCALLCKFSNKDRLQLRLLTEEMFSLLNEIVKEFEATFWMEKKDSDVSLHLDLVNKISKEQNKQLLELYESQENSGGIYGIIGKVAKLCKDYITTPEKAMKSGNIDSLDDSNAMPNDFKSLWSMNQYCKTADLEGKWDEVEKSIIKNLADDLFVGIYDGRIRITVKKTF